MPETLEFTLTIDSPENNNYVEQFLNSLVSIKDNHALMCNRLERYHWGMGTSPEVKAFSIELVKPATDVSGSFRCRFRVNYSFTCSGIESSENDTISWEYKIDKLKGTIFLQGETPLTRDSDDI
ncbi:hypothetical protein LJ707_12555 [Mucilaginibacter sp. UR6-1]|uniref:hypothetical protein n=1 Tax=Mucilaginibacter sp. UR6-1 TaxID=1435643 RepID=UPI001E44C4C3|nr:hypothetical protein [Mucilaginibacter sp. UR6-1]MCC8409762.1 hypothetical protein [Mucilaginibacter sp. UR6-1]